MDLDIRVYGCITGCAANFEQSAEVANMGVMLVPEPEPDTEPTFEDFWLLMVRRVAKKDARVAWARLDDSQHIQAMIAAAAWRRVWLKQDLHYVMHPATFLNGERYEDELPTEGRDATHAAHIQAVLPAKGERSAMPEHVRVLLAKLRAK